MTRENDCPRWRRENVELHEVIAMNLKTPLGEMVSAADISRNFGDWQSRAMAAPVVITHHGRPRLVLSSIEVFETWAHQPAGLGDVEATNHKFNQLRSALNEMSEMFIALDGNLRLIEANTAAAHFFGMCRDDLLGLHLSDVLPEDGRSPLWSFIERVIRHGEPVDLKLRSLARESAVLHVRIFPFGEKGVGLILRNISPLEEIHDLRSREFAVRAALGAMPGLALIRLDLRGNIQEVDEAFCIKAGFSKTQLLTMRFEDLLPLNERGPFERMAKDAIRTRSPRFKGLMLLTQTGLAPPVRVALSVALREELPESLWMSIADSGGASPLNSNG